MLDLVAQVRLGQDPAKAKEEAKEASKRQAADSFKAIATLYLVKQAKEARPRTHSEDTRYLMVTAASTPGTAQTDSRSPTRLEVTPAVACDCAGIGHSTAAP